MGIKLDCFAFNINKKCCNVLNKLYCRGEECKFYKNKNDVNRECIEKAVSNYAKYHK